MIRAELGLGILGTGLWIYCLLDVILADESRIRNLSKSTWIWVVLVTSVVGAVAWLVAGKPEATSRGLPYKGNSGFSEYDRPGRFAATDPKADEEFLKQVRERAEAQRREAKLQRLAREQREERERQEMREAHERRRLRSPSDPEQPSQDAEPV
ncbi:MAG: PLD nuclease N-terminal domain-containing protein [Pedococcus sp.]